MLDTHWTDWTLMSRWREEEWIVEIVEHEAYAPGWIVARHPVGDTGVAWVARPQTTYYTVPWAEVRDVLLRHGEGGRLRNRLVRQRAAAEEIADLFR
jgi:hypothetical protein